MEESQQIRTLLEEIRDLQVEHLAEYRKHVARSIELTEASFAKQAAIGSFYKRAVFGAAIVVAALLVLLAWMLV